mmetsp:Transcript_18078/g.41019  ORF Transcript_18078/g.41019 Transcript_18078/m.41019 type:complete len:200 (+) Transcript_18078:26-625(+)
MKHSWTAARGGEALRSSDGIARGNGLRIHPLPVDLHDAAAKSLYLAVEYGDLRLQGLPVLAENDLRALLALQELFVAQHLIVHGLLLLLVEVEHIPHPHRLSLQDLVLVAQPDVLGMSCQRLLLDLLQMSIQSVYMSFKLVLALCQGRDGLECRSHLLNLTAQSLDVRSERDDVCFSLMYFLVQSLDLLVELLDLDALG